MATSRLHLTPVWLSQAEVRRLPNPKVAGSRPVVRLVRVAGICTDSQGLAAGFGLLKRRTAPAADGHRQDEAAAELGLASSRPKILATSWLHFETGI